MEYPQTSENDDTVILTLLPKVHLWIHDKKGSMSHDLLVEVTILLLERRTPNSI